MQCRLFLATLVGCTATFTFVFSPVASPHVENSSGCTPVSGGPEISHNHTYEYHWLRESGDITFTVTCDEGQSPLEVAWEVNGIAAGIGTTFNFLGTVHGRGVHEVIATCTDSNNDCDSQTFYVEVFDADAFTFVLLPDTQYYVKPLGGGHPDMFYTQTEWAMDFREAMESSWVAHLGDVTEHGGVHCGQSINHDCYPDDCCSDDSCTLDDMRWCEWSRGDHAMALLTSPGFAYIPFSIAVGDHDYDGGSSQYHLRILEFFDHFFPPQRFASLVQLVSGYDDFGTYEVDSASSSYHVFSAGGLDFLHIAYEYNARAEVIDWVSDVIDAHPGRRVFLTTHSTGTGQGELSMLRHHPEIYIVAGGHGGVSFNTISGDHGNTVYRMDVNYQFQGHHGGNGYLRMLVFEPSRDLITARTYSPYRDINPHSTWTPILEDAGDPNDQIQNFDFSYGMSGDPVPMIAAYPAGPPAPPRTAVLDGTGSFNFEPNVDIVSYEWDFGDGSFAFGPIVEHDYLHGGTWEVTLTVTNSEHQTESTSRVIRLPLAFPEGTGVNWHGDVNRDGLVDRDDLDEVIDNFDTYTAFDATGSGYIDEYDVLSVLCNWGRLHGDVNRDCVVDPYDLIAVIQSQGDCPWPCPADVGGPLYANETFPYLGYGPDGVVDSWDIELIVYFINQGVFTHPDCHVPPTAADMAAVDGYIDPDWLDGNGDLDITACDLLSHWFDNPTYD